MSVPTISRDCASRLASYVETRRHEFVAEVVRSPALEGSGSTDVKACAAAFIDRFCQELDLGDRDAVDVWADEQAECEDAAERARIVTLVCSLLLGAYLRDCGTSDEVVAYVTLRANELQRRVDRAKAVALVQPPKNVNRDENVEALLAALEAYDPTTCEHARAVGMWCGRLAKAVGMNGDAAHDAVLAGILHDIGMLGISCEALRRAGPLDVRDWQLVRRHPQIGADLLLRIPSLAPLAPAVAAHHERVDGAGYPNGLHGDQIPWLGRIVAVADSFHAMISRRPYRSPRSVPDALAELRAGAGAQWDRAVVDAMLGSVQPTAHDGQSRLRAVR